MTGTCYGEKESFINNKTHDEYDMSLNQDILSSMLIETRWRSNIQNKPFDNKLAGVYNIMNKNRYANFTQLSNRRGKTKL